MSVTRQAPLNGTPAHLHRKRVTADQQLAELRHAVRTALTTPDGRLLPVMTYGPDQVINVNFRASELQTLVRLIGGRR
jgi:hypothetical protein